jgi:hypothetical protein
MSRDLIPHGEVDAQIVQVKAAANLVNGDVVIWDPTAVDGITVNTTTDADSKYVAGVMIETVASGAYGRMMVRGLHTAVKIDGGTTDVAAHALLSTCGVAGYCTTATGTVGTILGHAPVGVTTKTTGKCYIKLA